MKKVLKHTMSAAAAGGLLLVLYAMKELFPFGEFTVSWCDMNQQVVPLLCEFKDILEGKGSLFLNLQNAGGMNFWGVFLFFLSSPFSFSVASLPSASNRAFSFLATSSPWHMSS